MPLISHRVELARKGANDKVICRMASGWAVMGDVQFLPGYCLLLPDPVVASLNDLDANARAAYLLDMARIGDALLAATGALRINYEILGNSEPQLHSHTSLAMPRSRTTSARCPHGSTTGKRHRLTLKSSTVTCARSSRNC